MSDFKKYLQPQIAWRKKQSNDGTVTVFVFRQRWLGSRW